MQLYSKQRGLSLIELMIGMLLSSLLLLGVLQIFQGNTSTSRTQNAFSRVQESGRFAIDLLSKEIRAADYWGCAPDRDSIYNHPVSGFFSTVGADGVQGIDNASASQTVGGKTVATGSDVLVLGGSVDACGGVGRLVNPNLATPSSPVVTGNCPIETGDILLISNCRAGDVISVAAISGELGGGNRTITQSAPLKEAYGSNSKILKPYQRTYFIAASSAGDNSLFVRDELNNVQELVPGIEDMQVTYGRDTTGDGVLDIWQAADGNLDNMAQVTSVKLQLVVASDPGAGAGTQKVALLDGTETTYTDGRLRKLYVATVKVRNRGAM